jgi:hypothetical protein
MKVNTSGSASQMISTQHRHLGNRENCYGGNGEYFQYLKGLNVNYNARGDHAETTHPLYGIYKK